MILKDDIRKVSLEDLESYMATEGFPGYRAKQLWHWLWQKHITDFDEMNNMPAELRSKLKKHFKLNKLGVDKVQKSDDGTIKMRIKLWDGNLVETVIIPVADDKRFTVCVSSQVGCSLACKFCATGKMDRVRNLDASEIYDQVVLARKICLEEYDDPLTNIVYMGMGEPLLNYKNVLKSIDLISSKEGLGMSSRRITLSTVGIAKLIKKMADEEVKFNLALSLHAADDIKRDKIMPINEQNDLDSLMESLSYFYEKTKNRISYEYIAFNDFNVEESDAKNLLKLCRSFPVRVNIIEYNHVSGVKFERASEDKVNQFAKILRENGVMVTLRRSRGKDIDAACGQLANKE